MQPGEKQSASDLLDDETEVTQRRSADCENLTSVLDKLIDNTSSEKVSFKDLLEKFSSRVYGPLMLIPALLATAPTGAIPGMSILTGAIIAVLSLQLLLFRPHPWLPARLLKFEVSKEKLRSAIEFMRPYTEKVDQYIKPRLQFLTKAPVLQLSALICLVLSLLMFPLALVPFAVLFPGLAITLISLGLTSHDGLLILSGLLLSIGVFLFTYSYFY